MLPGFVFAERFEILAVAGSGAMGAVYRALDRARARQVAIKIPHSRRDLDVARLAREGRALASIDHPNVVRYLEHGAVADGTPYLVTEWLDGVDLETRLARGPLSLAEALELGIRAASALGHVHRAGVLHRDLKPRNLLLEQDDVRRVRVLDFGIARATHGDLELTQTGEFIGTPRYASPEQARGERELDPRSDVYSLATVIYRCLAGRTPFEGARGGPASAGAIRIAIDDAPPITRFRREVPDVLEVVLARALASDRELRPADGAALALALERVREATSKLTVAPGPARPSSIGSRELRVACLVVARATEGAPTPAVLDVLRGAVREGARASTLADGSLVVAFLVAERGDDVTSRAAFAALAIQRAWPDARVAAVAGRADARAATPIAALCVAADPLLAMAGPGEIVVDEVVARLASGRLELEPRGSGAFSLAGERRPTSERARARGPFVGRERELATLVSVQRESEEEPVARAALVLGPAGIGKTRLVDEALAVWRERADPPRVWFASADPLSAGTPLVLIRRLVRDGLGATTEQRCASLRALGLGAEADLAALVEVLCLAKPEHLRARSEDAAGGRRLCGAFEAIVAAASRGGSLVLVLEDLQWGDAHSVALLDDALRSLRGLPWMIVALARPEVREALPDLWARRAPIDIRLGELTRRAAERLARALAPDHDDSRRTELIERAAGHPLVLHELVRASRERDGAPREDAATLALAQARLTALSPELRRTLRAASVLGRGIDVAGASALLGGACALADVAARLEELARRDILWALEGGGADVYAFRHALLREATYATLTPDDRVRAHRRAGEHLARTAAPDPRAVARHFTLGERPDLAREWLLRVADAAEAPNALETGRDPRDDGATKDPRDPDAAVVPVLVVHDARARALRLIEERPAMVGRGNDCDLVIDDASISRRHARVRWSAGSLLLEDLGSKNGTWVAGERIEDVRRILPGEIFGLGSVTASCSVAVSGIDGRAARLVPWARLASRVADELRRAGRARPFALALAEIDGPPAREWIEATLARLARDDLAGAFTPRVLAIWMPDTAPVEVRRRLHAVVDGAPGDAVVRAGLALSSDGRTFEALLKVALDALRDASARHPIRGGELRASGNRARAARPPLVIESAAMRALWASVERVAPTDVTVLVVGETGSGKELVAGAMHDASARRAGPLCILDCGAIPPLLVESTLFGHVAGAFTGADRELPGVFERAHGGTIFLDEVGELPLSAQAAFLRVLETRRLVRVGGVDEIAVDVRTVAATHRDLDAMVAAGTFRRDLLYRLNAVTLRVPPLRERPEDLDRLATTFARESARAHGRDDLAIAPDARDALRRHPWPGNVRELRNVIERAVLAAHDADEIGVEHLEEQIAGARASGTRPRTRDELREMARCAEAALIEAALARTGGNQTAAARELGMPLRTLVHKLGSLGIRTTRRRERG